jgi:hypothetical protein
MAIQSSPRVGIPSVTTRYLQDVADRINELPRFSVFSFATPESNVTAQAPALGFNEASGASVLWAKRTGSGNSGWLAIA